MDERLKSIRAVVAWLLLAVETAITLPVFMVAWLVSAVGLAVVGGFRFAKLESSDAKWSVLMQALGEKGKK
ncbi:MAG: hypothetical protein CGW95_01415 [Phenylobacterium zucineum]|nr:MAG: hypothetical protein CGW95_01415 [Phenylobacterium zucineum]